MWKYLWYFEVDNGWVHVEFINTENYLKYLKRPLMKLVGCDLRRITKKRLIVADGFIDVVSFNYKKTE